MKTTGKLTKKAKQQKPKRERGGFDLNLAALERVFHIHYKLQNKGYPNATTVAQDLNISTDSAERVFNYMRDRLNFPMDYDRKEHGWFYTVPVDKFPVITLDAKDLFGLTLLEQLLKQYESSPLYAPLRALFDKLVEFASPHTKYSFENADKVFSTRPVRSSALDVKKFDLIQTAIDQNRVIKSKYRNHGRRYYYDCVLMPYGFGYLDDRWFVLADAPGRNRIHKYVFNRIKDPEITKDTFEKSKDYDPAKLTQGAFRIMTGTGNHKVELDLDLWATDIVSDRIWHETQTLEIRDDGTSRMTMQLSDLEEITCWILSHHIHAKVIGPPELKEKRREYIRALAVDEGIIQVAAPV